MELSVIQYVNPGKLLDFEADIFITALGYETRCTIVARLIEGKDCTKIALSNSSHFKEYQYEKNLDYFKEWNYNILSVETGGPDMGIILEQIKGDNIKIIIDCTSMSQRWIYEFFRWFSDEQVEFKLANLRIVYTPANYVDPGPAQKVKRIKEFLKTEDRTGKKKKKALILGLGHEENVCETIYKLVKPDLLYLFYADPAVDKQFVEKVFVNNHALTNVTPIRNLIAYPIRNGQLIYQNLIDTILPLRNEYSIILVPQGPKIFSVVSMLVHLGYPDTLISYPVIKKKPVVDRKPCGEPVVLDVHFEGEE